MPRRRTASPTRWTRRRLRSTTPTSIGWVSFRRTSSGAAARRLATRRCAGLPSTAWPFCAPTRARPARPRAHAGGAAAGQRLDLRGRGRAGARALRVRSVGPASAGGGRARAGRTQSRDATRVTASSIRTTAEAKTRAAMSRSSRGAGTHPGPRLASLRPRAGDPVPRDPADRDVGAAARGAGAARRRGRRGHARRARRPRRRAAGGV